MKILITGYKGFIGQNMVKAMSRDHDLILYEYGNPIPDFKGLDWVVHLGAITDTTEKDVEKIMKYNFDFSCVLLVACQANNVNLQYASSASVYGITNNFAEDSPCSPQNPYAWSKYLFDRNVLSLKLDNIIVQGFRYFNVYGPHEDHKGDQASPYTKFDKQAKETGVIKVFHNSHQFYRD
ncbi:MAG: NAD-dependent epimerase/dehydratase family protein, partial [Synechococcaceae bacterium WB8_1B_057]|nr:NAD-dependent epimerase/dehydratase family protein [Synechococcaceae bacterium WB8_1B_057]